eukprot:5985973-Pleurochrysis_carterae.AAC.1
MTASTHPAVAAACLEQINPEINKGTGARVPRRAVCADARSRAAAARGRHGQVRAWSDGATYMPPNTATDAQHGSVKFKSLSHVAQRARAKASKAEDILKFIVFETISAAWSALFETVENFRGVFLLAAFLLCAGLNWMKRAAASAIAPAASQPESNLVNIQDVNEVWKRLEPWQQELIARRWVKKTGRYYANVD